MDSKITAIFVVVLLSLLGVTGDYFLKLASGEDRFIWNRCFPIGLAIYASTAFGWVYTLRHLKLATIGVVYSMCMILLLAALGIVVFKERLTLGELAGIVMAVGSLILLSRFAGQLQGRSLGKNEVATRRGGRTQWYNDGQASLDRFQAHCNWEMSDLKGLP